MTRVLRTILPLTILAVLSGCGGPPPPPPAVLTLTLVGASDQNPGPAGAPTSVAIHVYYLSAPARFQRAEVLTLLDNEKATLADDLVGSETVLLPPGGTKTITSTMKPGVQVVGVAAAFREIDRSTWRALAPVAPHGPTDLTLTVKGVTITLAPPAKKE